MNKLWLNLLWWTVSTGISLYMACRAWEKTDWSVGILLLGFVVKEETDILKDILKRWENNGVVK